MSAEPQGRRTAAKPKRVLAQPALPLEDPTAGWGRRARRSTVEDLTELADQYPDRDLFLSAERQRVEFYSSPEQPNAFSMDSLEFFLVLVQYFREALPFRVILLLIACQRAGGRIHLTQEEMATVLDVPRRRVNETLVEIMEHGIVFKVARGVYQFNPPYSYRVAEWLPGTESTKPVYRKVEQGEAISEIRGDKALPDLVRFPSLETMRQEIERLRKERAKARAERAAARAAEAMKESGSDEQC
ncbi:hypothetical protein [Kitasatospora sp. NPDC087315]|uniref:hypothetical protein n=1 Tax=Kitasatospora sp. NPDC087315 TaxID=3364069 RepID=UPI00381C2132